MFDFAYAYHFKISSISCYWAELQKPHTQLNSIHLLYWICGFLKSFPQLPWVGLKREKKRALRVFQNILFELVLCLHENFGLFFLYVPVLCSCLNLDSHIYHIISKACSVLELYCCESFSSLKAQLDVVRLGYRKEDVRSFWSSETC